MNCKYIKNVPTGKHGMLCSWHVTCNCFLFYLLRALAPGVHSITFLTPISNGGGAFPYHYPTLFHETRLLKNAPTRDEAAEKCPTRDEAAEKCPDAGQGKLL